MTPAHLGLYISLVGSCLACAPWLLDAFGMVKVLVGLIGVGMVWISMPAPRRTPMDRPIAACLLVLAASTAVSVSPQLSVMGFQSQPFYGLLALSGAVLVYYAAQAWPQGPALCCAVVAIATGVACMIEHTIAIPPPFDLVSGYRAIGTVGSPVFMGAIIAVTVPACLAMGGRVGYVGVALGIFAMAASGSRGPWLAAGAGVAVYLAAAGRLAPRVVIYGCIAGVAVLVLRVTQSDLDRYVTWAIALQSGFEHPWLGWGPDSFFVVNIARHMGGKTVQASAHNDLLQAWCTTGGAGLMAYAWLWAAAIWTARARPAVLGSLAALFVVAKFNPVPAPAHYLMAALLGAQAPAGKPSRWIWAAGLAAVLVAPGMAARQFLLDGRGRVEARVSR